nr:hypothetical protein Iba_chr14fCG3580 [Ipomoea batatas]
MTESGEIPQPVFSFLVGFRSLQSARINDAGKPPGMCIEPLTSPPQSGSLESRIESRRVDRRHTWGPAAPYSSPEPPLSPPDDRRRSSSYGFIRNYRRPEMLTGVAVKKTRGLGVTLCTGLSLVPAGNGHSDSGTECKQPLVQLLPPIPLRNYVLGCNR